jgi:hypothetical protein
VDIEKTVQAEGSLHHPKDLSPTGIMFVDTRHTEEFIMWYPIQQSNITGRHTTRVLSER